MKGTAEARVRDALRAAGLYVYKPPDDARNWKPCDFFTWRVGERGGHDVAESRWVEVKTAGADALTLGGSELRPSQLAGVADAWKLGIPYELLVWWPKRQLWSGTDMVELQRQGEVWTLGHSLPLLRGDIWTRGTGTIKEIIGRMLA